MAKKGLPRDIIKKYGVTKKAWSVYRNRKGITKSKSKSNPSTRVAAKTSKKRRVANVGVRYYNKTEKAVGASRIAERVLNLIGFPPEPIKSLVTTGVGFARGGVPGGLGALVFSSNIIEMAMDQVGLGGGSPGNGGEIQGL